MVHVAMVLGYGTCAHLAGGGCPSLQSDRTAKSLPHLPILSLSAGSTMNNKEPPFAIASSASPLESTDAKASMASHVRAEAAELPQTATEEGLRGKFRSYRRRRVELRRLKAEEASIYRGSVKRTKSRDDNSGPSSASSPPENESADEVIGILIPAGDGMRGRMKEEIRFPCLSHGVASLIGRRREMEDAVMVAPWFAADAEASGSGGEEAMEPAMAYDFFGVYDGHGGARVAQACRERLHVVLAEEVAVGGWPSAEWQWREAMSASFSRVDEELEGMATGADERLVGSTAVVAVVGVKRIIVANCGDSRAVLSRAGRAMALSCDHKPDRPDEMQRVEAAGGRVINWDGYRVLGMLGTSRSIGDYYLKPYVISEPDVTVIDRTEKDEFLILASDGLWDVLSNEVACKIARKCLNGQMARMFPDVVGGCTASHAAALLSQLAISRGSEDNISVVVVELRRLRSRA